MFSFEEYIIDVFSSYQREHHISLHLLLLALSNLNFGLEEKGKLESTRLILFAALC
jgi:hypothetical protein